MARSRPGWDQVVDANVLFNSLAVMTKPKGMAKDQFAIVAASKTGAAREALAEYGAQLGYTVE
jgi:hypothetical protein